MRPLWEYFSRDAVTFEYTNRFGKNPPSYLRVCLECDAAGERVVTEDDVPPAADFSAPIIPISWGWVRKLRTYANTGGPRPYRLCRACGGTGRVGWVATVFRIPEWLVKATRFVVAELRGEFGPPPSLRRAMSTGYLNDLRALFR